MTRLDPDLSGLFAGDPRSGGGPLSPLHRDLPGEVFRAGGPAREHGPHDDQARRSSRRWAAAGGDIPERGAIIDKYRLEEILGVGGFAVVYRATHLLLRAPVALKLLRPKVVQNRPRLAELLCEEARFAAQINHPNVVRVYDVTHTDKVTYVVMEFIDGLTLAETIARKGALPPRRVIEIGLDVCAGLRAGLDQGLVHRDVKPANILITSTGIAKIVDLGLAQPDVTSGLRSEGQGANFVGTPGYMAPEQAQNADRVDFRADIYGLGVTLYHAAVGQPPFPLEDKRQVLVLHRTEPVPPPRQVRPSVPEGLSRLLLWMLAKDPAQRPPSYEMLMAELKGLILGMV